MHSTVSRRELRVLLLDELRLAHKATEATSNICSTMGEDDVLSIRTAQHWFNRFKNDNLELDDLPRSGRSPTGGFECFEAAHRRRS